MLAAPVPLLSTHEVDALSCGVESLDLWLKRRALNNQITGASRTFVVGEKNRVVAYCFCATSDSILIGRYRSTPCYLSKLLRQPTEPLCGVVREVSEC